MKKEKDTKEKMKKEKGTEEKMKKEKEKKGIQLPEKQLYALYREISLKRNYRLSGQCNASTITAQS